MLQIECCTTEKAPDWDLAELGPIVVTSFDMCKVHGWRGRLPCPHPVCDRNGQREYSMVRKAAFGKLEFDSYKRSSVNHWSAAGIATVYTWELVQ